MTFVSGITRALLAVALASHSLLHAQSTAQPTAKNAAQGPADEAFAKDMHEHVQRISVTVTDLHGRTDTRQIPITIFRPAGRGPFPLAVMNHGRSPAPRRQLQGRQRFENLARYLVSKGFAVLVPTRVGYGETYGEFDPEASGACSDRRIEPMTVAVSDQVIATVEFAKTLPYVDASRWIVLGQSVGGMGAVSVVYRNPPGLVGGINFSGGVGGNPDKQPGDPCRPELIAKLWSEKGAGGKAPMLWLYWENDRYWGAQHPKRWYQAYAAGGGEAQMHTLVAAGKDGQDGHGAVGFDMDHWVPLAERFLAQLGFKKPGIPRKPRPTNHAHIREVHKVPAKLTARETIYRRFLEAKSPRAFAVSPSGDSGWATGDWAMGRALGHCQQRGETCKLYAVDDDVVWKP